MAASSVHREPPITETRALVKLWSDWFKTAADAQLGEGLIAVRETGIDSLEAVFAEGLRRFDKSGEYAADGALGIVPWLRWKCKLSGPAAAERVTISRQLEELPETQKAFASGSLGYQHVCFMARTADHIGAAAVRRSEASLPAETVRRLACSVVPAASQAGPRTGLDIRPEWERRVDSEQARCARTLRLTSWSFTGSARSDAAWSSRYRDAHDFDFGRGIEKSTDLE